ncbi:MAG: peptide/nickel transport system substrate-binding protein [Acidimicrobiales bacterium]|jgi:peptide/nickel transport system substrate-binding protein
MKTQIQDHQSQRSRRWLVATAVMLSFALIAAACGGSSDSAATDETETTTVAPAGDVEGDETTEAPAGDGDLPAFAEGAAQPGGTYGGSLTVAHWFPPISLDPHTGSSGADHQVLYSMYDRLVHFKFDSLEFTPGLALSWEFPDPQTLVFNLREGVTFHDGTPFNAEAVAYNVERTQSHPNTKVPADLASVVSVEVIDDLTVQLNLSRPDSGLVGVLADRAGMMVSPTAAEAADDTQLNITPVGTGPFMLKEYAEGERLVLEKNPNYWQAGLPYLDELEWLFAGDEQSGLNGLRAGDVDVALTVRDGSQIADLESNSDLKVIKSPSLNTDGCYINDEIAPWDDVRVRRAFSMAIDRETLADVLTFGLAEPAYLVVPPQHWSSSERFDGVNGYDPEAARALLEEAGQVGMTFTMASYQNPLQIRKAELLQAAVAEIGMNMELEVQELSAWIPAMFTDRTWPMACAPWTGRPDPSQTVTSVFASEGYYSLRDVDRAGVDGLAAAAVATDDIGERAAAYEDLWAVTFEEEALWTPLWHNASITATRSNVSGYQLNLLGKGQVQFAWLEG